MSSPAKTVPLLQQQQFALRRRQQVAVVGTILQNHIPALANTYAMRVKHGCNIVHCGMCVKSCNARNRQVGIATMAPPWSAYDRLYMSINTCCFQSFLLGQLIAAAVTHSGCAAAGGAAGSAATPCTICRLSDKKCHKACHRCMACAGAGCTSRPLSPCSALRNSSAT